ncbi:P-loop NTPase [Streptomyces lavendulocolor]|uniref:P-loop NTPase n=1 Tax=Streptomyces lavendulocolor TaxID=67316 RepID=UPI0031DF5979
MEFDRRVQVRVHQQGGATFGSGYLVAPGLVLTAGHVVQEAMESEEVRLSVCRPDGGKERFAATVVWYRNNTKADAALVEVEVPMSLEDTGLRRARPQSLTGGHVRPPQRWGRIIGTQPHDVTVAGFPRMEREEGERLDGQLSGRILPGTRSLEGRYTVVSADATRAVTVRGMTTKWSGMSGAAAIIESPQGDLLCGVIREDVPAKNGTLLTATPVSTLLAYEDFARIIADRSGWAPLLEAAEPTAILEPASRLRNPLSPTMLLRADAEVVRFRGRTEELRALEGWCESDTDSFSVKVITGPGGQGKSRLARQLSNNLLAKGWVTGHLRGDLRDLSSTQLQSLKTVLPFLVVIDYADARPALVRQVIDQLRSCRHRTRILLLARDDGRWRTDGLTASHADEILARAPVTALAPLAPEDGPPALRAALFDDALADLSEVLDTVSDLPGRPASGWQALADALRAPDDLSGTAYASVLTLQTTALVTLLQSGTAPVPAPHEEPAEGTLLRHEQRYWIRAGEQLGPLPDTTIQRAVAVATLCGAADPTEAITAIGALPEIPPADTPAVAAWLRTLYPSAPDLYWGHIQPDRVGEYHVSRVLLDFDESLPLTALLARCSEEQQTRALTVLVRAAIADHRAGRTTRTSRIQKALQEAVGSIDLDPDVVRHLQIAHIAERTTSRGLEDFFLQLAQGLVAACQHDALDGTTAAQVKLAFAWSDLGLCHSFGGRHEEALLAARETLQIWRDLDRSHATRDFQYALAVCSSSSPLHALGRHHEAVQTQADGIALLEEEARKDPNCLDTLADQYQTLADMCRNLGLADDAVEALRRAVAISERLNAGSDHQFMLNLRRSNLVSVLASSGQPGAAAQAMADLVQDCRLAARRNPYRDEPQLITALANLGNLQMTLGGSEEACHSLQQAIEIAGHRRGIGIGTSDTDNGMVRHTLQLSLLQAKDGRPTPESLASLRIALDAWHLLDNTPPDQDFAAADLFSRVATSLVNADMWQAALEPALAALLHTYQLVCREPESYVPEYLSVNEMMNQINQHADDDWYRAIPRIDGLWERLEHLRPAAAERAREGFVAAFRRKMLGDQ